MEEHPYPLTKKSNSILILNSISHGCTNKVLLRIAELKTLNYIFAPWGVFGWLQVDTVAAVWTAAAAIHREKNTVEAAAAAGLQPQQAAANKHHNGMT
jgi:hypothetical protein